jgi:hypothetical protein
MMEWINWFFTFVEVIMCVLVEYVGIFNNAERGGESILDRF